MSETTKVYEFAKQIGMETIALMDKIRTWDLPVKSHMAAIDAGLQDEIKKRLEEETVSAKTTKKKATKKKKVAKKKPAAKKKKTTKKKTVVKKAVTKKTVTKKKASEAAESATATKKVIRRKAGAKEAEEAAAAAAALAAAEAAQVEAVAEAEASAEQDPAVEPSVAEAAKPVSTRGRNIVGKVDLAKNRKVVPSRTQQGGGARSASASGPGAGAGAGAAGMKAGLMQPRSQARGNIRTGFITQNATLNTEDEEKKRREERAKKKSPREEQKAFAATDFRKREVIFQPKKKKHVVRAEGKKTQITTPKALKRIVKVYENITVTNLADELKVKVPQLTKVLIKNGVMANMNTVLDFDTVSLIVAEFGFEAQNLHRTEDQLIESVAFGDLDAEKVKRPPVVTVMGHVDHGKTTLLDTIRKARVASGEAGGITQHIGAYAVKTDLGEITFIDTPGHEAFTAMRARGANVTDIAIIIVAADDGVMPQTEEAISHAKAAGVPIIVAVNKIDRPQANPEKIKQQLTEYELVPEEWGGDTIFAHVSALNGDGITELLEQINLLAEVQEYKANPKRSGTGIVIESRMEKGRGAVSTLLVKDGTVRVGDLIVAGLVRGKIRSLTNDQGKRVKEIGPGKPVEVTGLDEAPLAGDAFDVCKDESTANRLVDARRDKIKAEETPSSQMSLDQLFAKVKNGNVSELPLILKADVAGSIEAIKSSLTKIKSDEVNVNVIHSAVGGITESDILLASTSGGLVIGFNVKPDTKAQQLSKQKAVEIKSYKIIYELLDDIKKAMSGLLSPDLVPEDIGSAEVREVFSVPKIGVIAGTSVKTGKITRGCKVRLVREGKVIYDGNLSSLKRFKDDAKEVASGYECGIGIENYSDIQEGDIIEAYRINEVARTLD